MKPQTAALLGERVGHIRVVDVLGEGGMGAVYVGFDDKLQRKVALKAIRSEFRLHEEAKARFLREARILSQLDHPHICTVHEFIEGTDCDFLVLELVRGRSLRHAMEGGLDESVAMSVATQLLEVFVAVHGQGVIHRDLKPENVMITDSGEIKVLDFGLARSAEEGVGSPSLAPTVAGSDDSREASSDGGGEAISAGCRSVYVKTKLGTVLGTLGYMSPEQARGEPATAASDMYSIGMILQEMFTGVAPFEPGLDGRALLERAAQGGSLAVSGVSPDLEALINRLKSLAPGARPSSVDAAAELRRVTDAPRARRRRRVVAALWLLMAVLLAGMTLQSIRAGREARRAEREAEASREVSEYLAGLFEELDPWEVDTKQITAMQILAKGAEKIEDGLADQPLVRARLMDVLGDIYRKLGVYGQAWPLLAESLEVRKGLLSESHPEVILSTAHVAFYHWDRGDFAAAQPLLLEALAAGKQTPFESQPEFAKILWQIARLRGFEGKDGEAAALLERSIEVFEATLGRDHPATLAAVAELARAYAAVGRESEAGLLLHRALEAGDRPLSGGFWMKMDHSYALGVAGDTLVAQRRFAEARPAIERCAAFWDEMAARYPGNDRYVKNSAWNHLQYGNILSATEEGEQAIREWNSALDALRLLEIHPGDLAALDTQTRILVALGRLDEARPMVERLIQNGWGTPEFLAFLSEHGFDVVESPAVFPG